MDDILNKISEITASSKTEEQLKIKIEHLINQDLLPLIDVTIEPEYEKMTGFKGKTDAVYGHLTIEYKKPGTFNKKENINLAFKQIVKYLIGTSLDNKTIDINKLKRLAGVGLDGNLIFFVRFWPTTTNSLQSHILISELSDINNLISKFKLIGPYPINENSITILLKFFKGLSQKPLTAENLVEQFGPNSEAAKRVISLFYQKLENNKVTLVDTLYNQWKFSFGIIYGKNNEKAVKEIKKIADSFGLNDNIDLKIALFSIHTYFALIIKLIAIEILSLMKYSFSKSAVSTMVTSSSTDFKDIMTDLENGGLFSAFGVRNFLEGDYFRWYLGCWDNDVENAIRFMIDKLSQLEPTSPDLEPLEARDILKKLYQNLVPKKLRHDLGEYYTSDWLTERVLNQIGYDGDTSKRILDPSCGSGSFLSLAVNRARNFMEHNFLDRTPELRNLHAKIILKNIVGFDLNPLAVIAARTNYLLALGNLLRDTRPIEIPIYLCDSVLTPALQEKTQNSSFPNSNVNVFCFPTSVGDFFIPKAVLETNSLCEVTTKIEQCINLGYSSEEFIKGLKSKINLKSEEDFTVLNNLYAKILDLSKQGRNGIWARLLKNSFAPILQGEFDFVVGNPPWINWEHLADGWCSHTKDLWRKYGLFTLKGYSQKLGAKPDISMLFVYVCVDHYLKDGGQLGFVITQTVFKSKDSGDGFRRFKIGDCGSYLGVKRVEDLVKIKPFEGATNRTAIIFLNKGVKTTYPVPYVFWNKKRGTRISQDLSLQEVLSLTSRVNMVAEPVNKKYTSPWLTTDNNVTLSALKKVIGVSAYKAHAGCCTWLNGVYWIKIVNVRPDGLLVIENQHNIGTTKVPKVTTCIEPDLVYPLARGRDISYWKASPSLFIIVPQKFSQGMGGYSESILKNRWPHTYAYFKKFEEELLKRSGLEKYFNANKYPFWSLYNIGPYSDAPFKLLWKEQSSKLTCCVCSSSTFINNLNKIIIPDHKLMTVPFSNEDEAHYVCALLNSKPAQLLVKAYIIETSTSTHILENVNIPCYNKDNILHKKLKLLSYSLHEIQNNSNSRINELEDELDKASAELWGISDTELSYIKNTLNAL